MPLSVVELRGRRDHVAKELNQLVNQQDAEWTVEHQEKYDKSMNEIQAIDCKIKRITDVSNLIDPSSVITDADIDRFTKNGGGKSFKNDQMRRYLRDGFNALTQEDILDIKSRQTPDTPRNAMSTSTSSEGGYTVATEYFRELTTALKMFGGIRSVARVITSATGATINYSTSDPTSEEGEIVGQNAAVTGADTTFGNKSIDVYKYSSKKIAIPFELLQDSMFDVEAYVQDRLVMRIGRITNKHFVNGTGSGQPNGVVTGATAGTVGATGKTTSVGYDDLVNLEHSVDPAYRMSASCCYLMNDLTVRELRKLKDLEGRPIFVPGYDQTNPGGAPDRLMGRGIVVAQEIPAMAASAKSILFGDFSNYIIRDVMDITIFRMTDSAFTLNGQVGFVAFSRHGGNNIDVGGAIKYYQNSAS